MTLSINAQKGLVFGIGLGLLIIGCVIGGLWSIIVDSVFAGQMGLTKSSTSFGMWEETPVPMEIQVHFFNWTNAEEFANCWENPGVCGGSDIPHFTEIGPYVFSEHHTKVDLQWNENNDTVTFRQIRKWEFQREKSVGTLYDEITNINPIALTVEHLIRHMNPVVRIIADTLVTDFEPLYVTKTVGQFMFEGYEDELLNITALLNVSALSVPFDKFGYFYPRNNSRDYDGVFNMHTGTDDINLLGLMAEWNYKSNGGYYDGNCGRITGYTGELFPPIKEAKEIELFASEICSSVTLVRGEKYSTLGLEAYKYVGDKSTLDNGTLYPAKSCYCAQSQIVGLVDDLTHCEESCMPSGVRGISKCRYGAPLYLSFPHFYLADPIYTESVRGLNPDKEKHECFAVIEPTTGIPLDVKARMQVNLLLQSYKYSKLFANMPKIMMPIMWFTQSAELTPALANLTKLLINLPGIGMGTFFGLAAIGVLMLCSGLVITLRKGWKGDEGDKLLSDSLTSALRAPRDGPSAPRRDS